MTDCYFDFNIGLWPAVLLGIAAAGVLMVWMYCHTRMRSLWRARAQARRRPALPDDTYPTVSIILYTQGDAPQVEKMLPTLLTQDYPAQYEIIVVDDSRGPDVEDTVRMFRNPAHNLYMTYSPRMGNAALSTRKLSITLGIKAARNQVVALTTTDADIRSPRWLRELMYNFAASPQTEVVLGTAYVASAEDKARGRRRRSFDTAADTLRWTSTALCGRPFRGTGYNLAYRRDLFFAHKGFARHLNLKDGDDDIFISEIATRANTAVEMAKDSAVRLRHGNHPRVFAHRNSRYTLTERFIAHRPRVLFNAAGWLQGIIIAACVAAAILALPNLVPACASLLLAIILWTVDIYYWRRTLRILRARRLRLTIPWLWATLPLRRAWRSARATLGRKKAYSYKTAALAK